MGLRGFRDTLEAYGVDYQTTMDRFLGNETLYRSLLDRLFEDDSLQKLGGALASGDTAKAFEAAHTLKGVTGNMGLTPLYAALCTLVEPLRTGERRDDYPMLFQAVQTEFRRADELRAALKGEGRT